MATKVPMAAKVSMVTKVQTVPMATKRSLAVLASYEIWACFFVKLLKVIKIQREIDLSSYLPKNEQKRSSFCPRAKHFVFFICFLGGMMTSEFAFKFFSPLKIQEI